MTAVYEDSFHVYIVLEKNFGGELFDKIVARGKYSERQAAAICRSILTIVEKCHSLGVMHRSTPFPHLILKLRKHQSLNLQGLVTRKLCLCNK